VLSGTESERTVGSESERTVGSESERTVDQLPEWVCEIGVGAVAAERGRTRWR
jgi:hypothetical protein